MLWKQGETAPVDVENGIVIDFVEGRFVIIVKDDVWTEYEQKALHKNALHIYFVYERVCALFLLENVDSIDTSDASFDIHNCDYAKELLEKDQYELEIYLLDSKNMICAARAVTFDKKMSAIIKESLQKQMDTPYDDEGFDRALAKIQGTYEPFEMEEMALCKGVF